MNACTTGKRYALCSGPPSVRFAMDGCLDIWIFEYWSDGLTFGV